MCYVSCLSGLYHMCLVCLGCLSLSPSNIAGMLVCCDMYFHVHVHGLLFFQAVEAEIFKQIKIYFSKLLKLMYVCVSVFV